MPRRSNGTSFRGGVPAGEALEVAGLRSLPGVLGRRHRLDGLVPPVVAVTVGDGSSEPFSRPLQLQVRNRPLKGVLVDLR